MIRRSGAQAGIVIAADPRRSGDAEVVLADPPELSALQTPWPRPPAQGSPIERDSRRIARILPAGLGGRLAQPVGALCCQPLQGGSLWLVLIWGLTVPDGPLRLRESTRAALIRELQERRRDGTEQAAAAAPEQDAAAGSPAAEAPARAEPSPVAASPEPEPEPEPEPGGEAESEARTRPAAGLEALPEGPFGMAWIQPGGTILAANRSLLELLARSAEELRQCSWQLLTHPEDLAAELAQATQLLSGQRDGYRLRKRFLRPDGQVRWTDVAVSAQRSADGNLERLLLQCADIDDWASERAQQQQRLQQLQLQLAHGSDLIVALDPTLQPLWSSPACQGLLAAPPGTTAASSPWLQGLQAVLRRRRSGRQLVELPDAEGVQRLYTLEAHWPLEGEGSSEPVIAVLQNVDRSERQRQQLQEQNRRQQQLLDGETTARLLLEEVPARSGKLRVLTANRAAERALGDPARGLEGRLLSELEAEVGAPLQRLALDCLARDCPIALEHEVAGGAPRVLQLEAQPLQDAGERSLTLAWWDDTERVTTLRQLSRSERDYRLLAENCTDVVFRLDPAGVVAWVSPSLTRVLGWLPEQWIGRRGTDYLRHRGSSETYQRNLAAIAAGQTVIARDEIQARDGSWHWVETHAGPYRDENGRIAGAVAFFRPLDEQVAMEQALRRSQRSNALLARSTGALLLLCRSGQIQAVSEGAEELLKLAPEALVGQPLQELVAPEERSSHTLLLQQAALGRSLVGRSQLIGTDGRRLAVEVSASPLEEGSSDLCVVYRLLNSQGDPLRGEGPGATNGGNGTGSAAVSPFAQLDPLTGLLRRGPLFSQLQALLRQRRQRDRIALLLCDLDQLAALNAQQGRDRGDLLLQTTAMRVRSSTRDGDLLGRLGGDELLVVLQDVGSLDVAIEVAEKIRRAVHEPIAGSGSGERALIPSLSIGVTLLADQEELDSALARADAATFAAKARGGNQVIVMPAGPAPPAIRSGTGSVRKTPR